MKPKSLLRAVIVAVLGSLLVASALLYRLLMQPNVLVNQPDRQLTIPNHISFRQLERDLVAQGYLARGYTFRLVARLLRYDRRVIPGAYRLKTNMNNWEAVRLLRAGVQHPVKVVLHQANTKEELAAKITHALALCAEDFALLLDDPAFVSQYGFTPENVMTMFIPNTYEVYWTITPKGLFDRMYKEYQRFWHANRLQKAARLRLTPQEVSILASIVQNEAYRVEEAPVIAGVFVNRLKKGIPLQSDITVRHAVGDPSIRRILHKDTKVDSAYNTYQHRGLPPGPLNVPSIAMIDAVLNFTAHNYLFFCGKEDLSGYTYFSKTLHEHLVHARRYQKALNKARIYR